jgi:ABC-2 type transport system ATP-binding protein
MLKIENISKKFDNKQVLKDISFEIPKNCVVGLLGPNGAGKTTLMRTIVGFYSANKGEIYWNNKKVDTKSEKHKTKIGYLPENNPLYINLTAGEYLEFIASLKQIEKTVIKDEVMNVAQKCGLGKVLGQQIETLSKGYKQRVGLAAALLGDPKILILDEPTTGLDPNQIIEIRDLIKSLSKNKMILLSTHILPEAKEICQRLLIINQGEIVLNEETKKIKNLEKKFVELTA